MILIVWSIVIALSIVDGNAQNFSCDASLSQPLCPGVVKPCTCVVSGTTSFTRWLFTTLNLCSSSSNLITLIQVSPCLPPATSSSGTCGTYLSVANRNTSGSSCQTSTLNITVDPSLNGLVIECRDYSSGGPGTLIGSQNLSIIGAPKPVENVMVSMVSVNQLTVTWAPPITGDTPTSYIVSINDTNNTLVSINATGPLQDIFTSLTHNTVYNVSVQAMNCAGSSSVTSRAFQTLPLPPDNINIVYVFNFNNNTLRELEITWTPVGGSVTMYRVYVGGVFHGNANCPTSPCFYVVPVSGVSGPSSSYNTSVASINGGGIGPMSGSILTQNSANNINITNMTDFGIAIVNCSFSQPYYCLVCCSAVNDSVPPDTSRSYTSTTNGTMVTVTLQGLGIGQLYYCKAAATNTNVQNCSESVVWGVKVFFSLKMPAMITSQSPSSTPSSTTNIVGGSSSGVGAIVGALLGGAFLIILVVIITVVIIMLKKKGGSKDRDDQMELEKSATMDSNKPGAQTQGDQNTGALYQDPNAIQRVQAPGGETYAVADKPAKATDKSKKPNTAAGSKSKEDQKSKPGAQAQGDQNTGALYQDPNAIQRVQAPGGETYAVADKPAKATDKSKKPNTAADTSGSMYQDPKDIQHTTAGGEEYAVAGKKPPKPVGHTTAPTGDEYAVADTKQPKRKQETEDEDGANGVSL